MNEEKIRVDQRTLRTIYSLIKDGDHKQAKKLIPLGARHYPLCLKNPPGAELGKWCLLHFAILKGSYEIIEYLLDGGADVELLYNGQTPFLFAVSRKKLKACELLLDRKADINARGCRGLTSLHHAVLNKNMPMIQFLLSANARLENDDYGRTPLDYANAEIKLLFEGYEPYLN